MIVYRWLEAQLGVFSGCVLSCSGRDVLVSIYRRRSEFLHYKVAWLADLDMWRFSPPPKDLGGVIFTTGYSIENDLYAGSQIEALLEDAERVQHKRLLGIVCRWFAFEIQEHSAGRDAQVGHRVRRVVDFAAMELSQQFCDGRGYCEPSATAVSALVADYQLSLRGKTLMELLITLLSDSRRQPKYSRAAIIELCLKLYGDNPYMKRLLAEANQQLS